MKILKLFEQKQNDVHNAPTPVIAFLGDSVTQGCFGLYMTSETEYATVFDSDRSYSRCVEEILHLLYPKAPVHIINAGISGGNAVHGYQRLERDVLKFRPDLTVVCFGLNDCNNRQDTDGSLYREHLVKIFRSLQEHGSEVIFMTPNMMNTEIIYELRDRPLLDIAEQTKEIQCGGRADLFMENARSAAKECGVPVCDVYALWKAMAAGGVKTTALLSNYINHPIPALHKLFAAELVKTMFCN